MRRDRGVITPPVLREIIRRWQELPDQAAARALAQARVTADAWEARWRPHLARPGADEEVAHTLQAYFTASGAHFATPCPSASRDLLADTMRASLHDVLAHPTAREVLAAVTTEAIAAASSRPEGESSWHGLRN